MIEINCGLVIENDEIKLKFEGELGSINFSNENQEEIKLLFNNLLGKMIENEITLKLNEELPQGVPQVHLDVTKEYIDQMGTELSIIRQDYVSRYEG